MLRRGEKVRIAQKVRPTRDFEVTGIVAQSLFAEASFSVAEVQWAWGKPWADRHTHEDGVHSMLHMAVGLDGNRELKYQVVDGDIDKDDTTDNRSLECRCGSVYVSSPASFYHRVNYKEPTMALQLRSATFSGRRSD